MQSNQGEKNREKFWIRGWRLLAPADLIPSKSRTPSWNLTGAQKHQRNWNQHKNTNATHRSQISETQNTSWRSALSQVLPISAPSRMRKSFSVVLNRLNACRMGRSEVYLVGTGCWRSGPLFPWALLTAPATAGLL